MRERFRNAYGYSRRNWMPSAFVLIFGAIGVVLLFKSSALSPTNSPTPSETVQVPSGQSNIVSVKPILLNATTAQLVQTGSFPLRFTYPSSWLLYKLDRSSASSAPASLYLRLLSPEADIGGQAHNSEITLSKGAMIETTAYTNNQFSSVDQYMKQLGENTQNIKKITVNGFPAVEYQIVSEDQDGTPPKTVITFFNGQVQYAVSLTVATPADYTKYISTFHQIVQTLSVE